MKVSLDTLARLISRRTEPRVKLQVALRCRDHHARPVTLHQVDDELRRVGVGLARDRRDAGTVEHDLLDAAHRLKAGMLRWR